ncbi:phosphonate C-P lyase system protein PhnG [Sporolactobacillus terrae]|nr:phosphonate C-P lyase system protein PhnG [Sporolactobacillus terrae]
MMMNKQRLSRILNACSLSLLKEITEQLEQTLCLQVERFPQTSLVMMKARDSVSDQPFYVGEVLVTECTVSFNQKFGIGLVVGEAPQRAYCMAAVDAAINAGFPILEQWRERLEAAEGAIIAERNAECARSAESQVHFDTMGAYNDRH